MRRVYQKFVYKIHTHTHTPNMFAFHQKENIKLILHHKPINGKLVMRREKGELQLRYPSDILTRHST